MTRLSPADRPESALPQPPLGRLYDVGGRRLMLHRSGSGGPTVVFLPGAGLVGLDYLNTHNRVAELTTSVLYDRAGTGWSEEVELPRSAAEVTGELRDLLRTAGVPTPYVLVGHSLGGAYARRYAQRFPDEVAGLLLLDPFHEDLLDHAPQEVREKLEQLHQQDLPEATHEQLQQARDWATPFFAKWPASVRQALVEHHLATWKTGLYEARNVYDDVAHELRHAPGLPDVPLIALTVLGYDATQAQLWSEEALRENNNIKTTLHKRLAASVPRGEHRTLDDAGHGWLHEEQPESVLQAITDLLRTAAA
ncbi:Pimeloyl-ACP methyl ester carboxylesterase [Streptomyces sp. 2112.3]|uniref:alpha/beta fold hydrolase n=1 Tax=Streptomyces sp. 2112.3 TaxID=1881023 RepID=UPI0008996F7A|nr:alpha/beta hydrolase [Streptomyces sp. 2112.3]SED58935.1 Pimeloyl-ACP methyl ester carboxylesterase [Streptomyces sp. 2112.3]